VGGRHKREGGTAYQGETKTTRGGGGVHKRDRNGGKESLNLTLFCMHRTGAEVKTKSIFL